MIRVVTLILLTLSSCEGQSPESTGLEQGQRCTEDSQCAEGLSCESLVCVSPRCELAHACCASLAKDSACTERFYGTTDDALCDAYLEEKRLTGQCVADPDDTTFGLCSTAGECDRGYRGASLCCDGFSCQFDGASLECAACASASGAACRADLPASCCEGLTCLDGTCVPLVAAGGFCQVDDDCQPGLDCEQLTCVTP